MAEVLDCCTAFLSESDDSKLPQLAKDFISSLTCFDFEMYVLMYGQCMECKKCGVLCRTRFGGRKIS